jgi:hypothetical protein
MYIFLCAGMGQMNDSTSADVLGILSALVSQSVVVRVLYQLPVDSWVLCSHDVKLCSTMFACH